MAKIPDRLRSLKVWGALDASLGIACWIFQIASASGYSFYFESLGAGFWIGVLLVVTAVAAWMASRETRRETTVGCVLVLSIESFLGGFVLLGINAAGIDQLRGCFTTKEACSITTGIDAILLICGLLAIVVNGVMTLMVLTSMKLIRPAANNEMGTAPPPVMTATETS